MGCSQPSHLTSDAEATTPTGVINKNVDIRTRSMFQKEISDLEISDLKSGMFVRL